MGNEVGVLGDLLPSGTYSITELSPLGLTEAQARERYDHVVIGGGVIRGIHVIGTCDWYL